MAEAGFIAFGDGQSFGIMDVSLQSTGDPNSLLYKQCSSLQCPLPCSL